VVWELLQFGQCDKGRVCLPLIKDYGVGYGSAGSGGFGSMFDPMDRLYGRRLAGVHQIRSSNLPTFHHETRLNSIRGIYNFDTAI
jgi:hypothetical protein